MMSMYDLKRKVSDLGYRIQPTKYGDPVIVCRKCRLPVAAFYASDVRGIGAIGRHRDIFTSKALLSYLARSNCCDHKRMYRLLRSRWIQKAPLKIDRAIVNNELPDVLAIRYYRMRAL